jgi:PAS domain S-box-containing protein
VNQTPVEATIARESLGGRFRGTLRLALVFLAGASGYLAGLHSGQPANAPSRTVDITITQFGKPLHLQLSAGVFGVAVILAVMLLIALVVRSSITVRRHRRNAAAAKRGLEQEIGARGETEHALLESQERTRSIVDAALDAIITMDDKGKIAEFNPSAERLFGYRRQDVVGRPLADAIIPDHLRESHRTGLARYLATGEAAILGRRLELSARRADGSGIDVELTVTRVPGTPPMFAGFIRDLSDRKRAEVTRGLLASIVESSDDAILSTTVEGLITSWNVGAQQLYGYSAEEIMGEPVSRLTPQSGQQEDATILSRVRRGESVRHHETLGAHKDGHPIDVSLAVSPLRGGTGAIIGASRIARDISVRRLLEQQLRQSQRIEAVGRLAGGIAHDFNNILSAIIGFAELVRPAVTIAEASADLRQVIDAAERGAALTRQLLAFSRQQLLQPQVLDLNDVVREMQPLLTRLIGEDITLQDALDSSLGPVRADKSQIEQIIMNLAVNARDAMPNGGHLTIETANVYLDEHYVRDGHTGAAMGPHVMIAVTDTGSGIDPATQDRIFEPFFTTKELGKGTGLGLSTVFGIVKQSGGSIWVYSEPGRGTTFKIYLPRHEGRVIERTPTPAVPTAAVGARGAGTVLLVEDDEAIRTLVIRLLRGAGYSVLDAKTGPDGLNEYRSHTGSISLILTDLVLPGFGGRELVKQLSEQGEVLPPVLYMSGYTADAMSAQSVLESGAAFIEKPFTLEALLSKVRETLGVAS